MIGHLNMTFKELNNGELTGVSIECKLKKCNDCRKVCSYSSGFGGSGFR